MKKFDSQSKKDVLLGFRKNAKGLYVRKEKNIYKQKGCLSEK